MISKYVPTDHTVVVFEDCQMAFGNSGRAWDEFDHDLVVLQLPERPLLYGEWVPRFFSNEIDFYVEVLSFGFVDALMVGSRDLASRQKFPESERKKVEELIRRLFASAAVENAGRPFTSPKARFLEEVHFQPDWLRT